MRAARSENRAKSEREHSSIPFPYVSFEDAFVVARAIFDAGGVAVDKDQLSGIMSSVGSFQQRLGAARIFGLIEPASGKYQLTQLAYAALDKNEGRQKAAKAEAFLSVPLFKKVYEDFKGKMLPPRLGLEQTFVRYGVPEKMKRYARVAFEKSAAQTGFYINGNQDRLVAPILTSSNNQMDQNLGDSESDFDVDPQKANSKKTSENFEHYEPQNVVVDPLIQGMLKRLPAINSSWDLKRRAQWLQTFAMILSQVYQDDSLGEDEITISLRKPSSSSK